MWFFRVEANNQRYSVMNYKYAEYNREERNLCSHLFRLLLMDHPKYKPLKEFVGDDSIVNPRIFSEVALIRDAYHIKEDKGRFVNNICNIIAKQEDLNEYRYSFHLICHS